ncbi:MAG TPA: cytochrome c3 family protein, partial [Pyrinomonadaceae bacterium]|nr:cytochrome c3 family protein [Pyrinomonadaceae bacterium]
MTRISSRGVLRMTTTRRHSFLRLAVIGAFTAFGAATLFTTGNIGQKRRATPKTQVAQAAQSKWKNFNHASKAHKMACDSCHKFPSDNWQKVRSEKDAFPDITDYPKHDSCLKCHQQQFFRGTPPAICSNCHVQPGPKDSTRFPYPNPRELFDKSPKAVGHTSDFAVTFPHDKHIEIVSQLRGPVRFVNAGYVRAEGTEASCAVCHQTMKPLGNSTDEYLLKPPANLGDNFWLKKGT